MFHLQSYWQEYTGKKDICSDENVNRNRTNHSLRATGATVMYHAGVSEKAIQETTGHVA